MLENYFTATNIVNKKYDSTDKYYYLYIISLFSFITKYNNYIDLISNLFLDTDIYIEDSSIINLINKYNLSNIDNYNDLDDVYGLSFQGSDFCFENNKIVINENNPIILIDSTDINESELLNIFIHEFNHLLKGINNNYEIFNNENSIGYIVRNGLNYHIYEYDYLNEYVYEQDYYNILDEIINTLETTELTINISNILDIIDNSYTNLLDKDYLMEDFGYERLVNIFKPLWNNNVFRNLIEEHLIDGNIDVTIDKFNSLIGEDYLLELDSFLDEYNMQKSKKIKRNINKHINYFTNSITNKNLVLTRF